MVIKHRESEIVMMVLSMDGIVAEIFKRVIHPTHVPFKIKAESTKVRGTRDLRPRGGFLGDRDDTGVFGLGDMIELPQELDRLEIFAPAVLVGNPLTGVARVIQIEHRGDGIDAQTIDMEAITPEEGISQKEITHLVAAIIENQSAPVLMGTLAWIFMLVKGGAIEPRKGPVVAREVCRHPI